MNVVATTYDSDRRQTVDATSPTRGKTKLAWDAVHVFRLGADGAPAIEILNLR